MYGMPNSFINVHIQSACCIVRLSAMYSASMLDKATVGCFFDVQDIGPPMAKKTIPDMDF